MHARSLCKSMISFTWARSSLNVTEQLIGGSERTATNLAMKFQFFPQVRY